MFFFAVLCNSRLLVANGNAGLISSWYIWMRAHPVPTNFNHQIFVYVKLMCDVWIVVRAGANFDLVDELISEKDDTEDKDLQVRSFSCLSHNQKLN